MKFKITHVLTEKAAEDILSQYVENPYGIGAEIVWLCGRFCMS